MIVAVTNALRTSPSDRSSLMVAPMFFFAGVAVAVLMDLLGFGHQASKRPCHLLVGGFVLAFHARSISSGSQCQVTKSPARTWTIAYAEKPCRQDA